MRLMLGLLFGLVSAMGASGASGSGQGFIFGRVTLVDGTVHEGRLRWGGDEEVLWNHSFYGVKANNPWARLAPEDALTVLRPVRFLGLELGDRRQRIDLERPLLVRFGDLSRIEARGRELTVTLRSGRIVELDRYEADDFADGLHIEDRDGRLVEIGEWSVRRVDFTATPDQLWGERPLWGRVQTDQATFAGLIQWDRTASLASDRLVGDHEGDRVEQPFESIDTIESIGGAVRVRLRNGETFELNGTRGTGEGHRGVHVDDPRYGRVLVSWPAVRRVEFAGDPGFLAPAYEDFQAGQPLRGSVSTRDGRKLVGRIVFDLDESETIETLDAPRNGVHYNLPFDRIASVDLVGDAGDSVVVTLRSGESLRLSREGDLGPGNAGLLLFIDAREQPEYLAWDAVLSIAFEGSRPPG